MQICGEHPGSTERPKCFVYNVYMCFQRVFRTRKFLKNSFKNVDRIMQTGGTVLKTKYILCITTEIMHT